MAKIISKCKAILKLNKSKAITLIQSHKSFIIRQENNCQRIFLSQKYRRNWCMNELQFTKYSLIWQGLGPSDSSFICDLITNFMYMSTVQLKSWKFLQRDKFDKETGKHLLWHLFSLLINIGKSTFPKHSWNNFFLQKKDDFLQDFLHRQFRRIAKGEHILWILF